MNPIRIELSPDSPAPTGLRDGGSYQHRRGTNATWLIVVGDIDFDAIRVDRPDYDVDAQCDVDEAWAATVADAMAEAGVTHATLTSLRAEAENAGDVAMAATARAACRGEANAQAACLQIILDERGRAATDE